MSNRTRSIDENLVEFMEKRAKLSFIACDEYKRCKEKLPVGTWKFRRDLLLMHQGAMISMRGVMSITGVIPNMEIIENADAALAQTILWIERNKLRKATHARAKRSKA